MCFQVNLYETSHGHGVHPLRHFYYTSPGSLQTLCGSSIGPIGPLLDIYRIVTGLLLNIYLIERDLKIIRAHLFASLRYDGNQDVVTKIVVTKMVTKMQLLAPYGTGTAQGAGVPVRLLARASFARIPSTLPGPPLDLY